MELLAKLAKEADKNNWNISNEGQRSGLQISMKFLSQF